MQIRVDFEMAFEFVEPTPLLMMMSLHPSRDPTVRRAENLSITPYVPITQFSDAFGNRCARACVPAGQVIFRNEAIVEDCGLPDQQAWNARQVPVPEIPDSILVFLLSSRYCEVDSELKDVAWRLFGATPTGWPRVQAVCDFVHQHLRFDYMQARATRTALDAYRERVGVCRDYTHLAITFCRCLNIPARYCTGYLGDIGIPPQTGPMDFSAWLEVYLDGRWYTLDARNHVPRIGRVLMARGRDATDVALTTTFGFGELRRFRVGTEEVGP
jgi:transglutaminase-like putative cysteine protease